MFEFLCKLIRGPGILILIWKMVKNDILQNDINSDKLIQMHKSYMIFCLNLLIWTNTWLRKV